MKKLTKNPAFWVILILLLLGIFLFILLNKKEQKGYLLLFDISNFSCTTKSCTLIEPEQITEKNGQENYVVYENGLNQGIYKIKYINKWNFFDQENNWVNLNDNYIAGSENLKLQSKPYELRSMNAEEKSILEKYLKENHISSYSMLEQEEVLEYDLNHDGKNEKVILASNVGEATQDEKLFVFVITITNKKPTLLYKEIYNQYENFEVPTYQIKGIVNLMEQKEDILILLKGYYSEVGKSDVFLYKVEKNKFKNIIE